MQRQSKVGKVIEKQGEFFLETEGKPALALSPIVDEAQLKEMVGKDVEILYTDPKPSIVGIKTSLGHRCYFILCYVPIDIFGKVDDRVTIPVLEASARVRIAEKLLKAGTIDQATFERMR